MDTHKADTRGAHTERTRFGGAAKVATQRTRGGTQGGHMADMYMAGKVWRRGQSAVKADTKQTRGGHKAGTWRTQC